MTRGGDPALPFSLKGKRIWVAGHRGMVGAAVARRLASQDCVILTAGRETIDLRRQAETEPSHRGRLHIQTSKSSYVSRFA